MRPSYRVISLRQGPQSQFCYVGPETPDFTAHPLSNPYRGKDALVLYREWFFSRPDLDQLLEGIRADSECGRLPLACWCGHWRHGQPSIPCHAVLIAKTLIDRYPADVEGMDW